jgi:hypothetical protein
LALGWIAVIFAAGAGLVTGFSMSFAAIRELGLMARMSVWTAPMLPIGIDALVITGLGMVALFRPHRAAEPAVHREAPAQGTVSGGAEQFPRDTTTEQLPERPAPPAAVTREAAVQVTRPAEQSIAPVAPQAPRITAEHPLTWDDAVTEPLAVQLAGHPAVQVTRDAERPAEQEENHAEQSPEQLTRTPEAPRPAEQAVTREPPEQSEPQPPRAVHRGGLALVTRDPEVPRPATDHRAIAEQLVSQGRTNATVEQVEQVLAMTAEGASQRVIAQAVGISSTAVGRIQAAARELADQSA